MKGKLTTNLSLTANTSIPRVVHEGGASSWNEISGKPFETISHSDFGVEDGELQINKSSVLDGYATEQYVDTAIAGITTTVDWDDIEDKPTFATVATSGDYNDLDNLPTIPQPTSITVTQTLSTGTAIADIEVDGVTTTLYAPTGGGSTDWADITNKPSIASGTGNQSIVENSLSGDSIAPNTASGACAHAEGFGTTASGTYSHAEGSYTAATSSSCHAEGDSTNASGFYSHAEGFITKAASECQHVQGRNNIHDSNGLYLDSIGNGTVGLGATRSNAEATDWSGNKYLAGDIYTHVTNWTNPQANSIKLANIPAPPTTDGTYTLQATVSNGTITYSWI